MNVLSVPQLYAYVVGWWQYDVFWQILQESGLFYIPFAVIFGQAVIVPLTSQETRSAATTALKRLGVSLVSLLIIIPLFCSPAVFLNINSVSYVKEGENYTIGKTNTTYDKHLDLSHIGNGVSVPLGWVLSLAVFNGIAGAGFNSLTGETIGARAVQQSLAYSQIKDPKLKAEVNDFLKSCYTPAYADYINHNYPERLDAAIKRDVQEYGQSDLGWAGSNVLVNNLYYRYQANKVVTGFPFDTKRDAIQGQVANHSQWGKPYCNEWWNDNTYGLRAKLWDSLNKQAYIDGNYYNPAQWFVDHYSVFSSSDERKSVESAAIYWYLMKSLQQNNDSMIGSGYGVSYYSENSARSGYGQSSLAGTLGNVISKAGVIVDYNTTWTAYLMILLNMLPIIQAMMLLVLFTLLPFGIVLSCFSWRFIITALSMAFAIIMMTYLWHLVSYFENLLIVSLYESPMKNYQGIMETIGNYLTGSLKPAQIIVDMTCALMYLGFPAFLFGLISWAGFRIGDGGFSNASRQASGQSQSSSKTGASTVGSVVSSAGKGFL
jgi:TraG-like protein, N-terminal region